jgi:hypothetical protein
VRPREPNCGSKSYDRQTNGGLSWAKSDLLRLIKSTWPHSVTLGRPHTPKMWEAAKKCTAQVFAGRTRRQGVPMLARFVQTTSSVLRPEMDNRHGPEPNDRQAAGPGSFSSTRREPPSATELTFAACGLSSTGRFFVEPCSTVNVSRSAAAFGSGLSRKSIQRWCCARCRAETAQLLAPPVCLEVSRRERPADGRVRAQQSGSFAPGHLPSACPEIESHPHK